MLKNKDLDETKNRLYSLEDTLTLIFLEIQSKTISNIENIGHDKKAIDKEGLKNIFQNVLKPFEQYSPDNVEPLLKDLKERVDVKQLASIERYYDELDFDKAKDETLKLCKELGIDV